MKVKTLIALLGKLDPNARVVVKGYEGGLDDVIAPQPTRITLKQYSQWYYGPHEHVGKGERGVSAVLLERKQ